MSTTTKKPIKCQSIACLADEDGAIWHDIDGRQVLAHSRIDAIAAVTIHENNLAAIAGDNQVELTF